MIQEFDKTLSTGETNMEFELYIFILVIYVNVNNIN